MDTKKKPFRCKYIYRIRYTRTKTPQTPIKEMVRPNLDAMPKGMTMERLDQIIAARGKSRMNVNGEARADSATSPQNKTL